MGVEAAPLVSVLIPLYNHQQFIAPCLDSILADDYPRLEVVVIDDGSGDASVQCIEQWRRHHDQAFEHFRFERQQNCGVVKTLNRLTRLARGDYLAILASNDQLLPGGIEARVAALDEHPHWLGVIGDCVMIDQQGVQIAESGVQQAFVRHNKRALADSRLLPTELILRWGIPGPVFMARRHAYDAELGVGGYNEHLSNEDRDFLLRLVSRQALGYIDQPVSAYRVHGANTCGPASALRLAEGNLRSESKNLPAFAGINRRLLWLLCQRGRATIKRLQRRPGRWLADWTLDRSLYAAILAARGVFDLDVRLRPSAGRHDPA